MIEIKQTIEDIFADLYGTETDKSYEDIADIICKRYDLKCIRLDDEEDYASSGAESVLDLLKNNKITDYETIYMSDYIDSKDTLIFIKEERKD